MVQRIADQLVSRSSPSRACASSCGIFHRDRELLLVLDNLEQIEASDVAQVVMGC
jgi:hypothetical protein